MIQCNIFFRLYKTLYNMWNLVSFLGCVFVVIISCSAKAPPFLAKCATDDAKCAKDAAQVAIPLLALGIPEFNVAQLDPIVFKRLDASTPTLKLIMTDVTMTGLKGCRANKVTRNQENTKLVVTATCDINMKGHYDMKGQLLFVPIEGKGRSLIKLKKISLTNNLTLGDMTDGNGVRHWDIKGWKHNYELKDRAHLQLENLFEGNDVMARVAQEMIATSGNEIVVEVGPPIISTVVARMTEIINNMFHKIPAEDLEL